MEHLDAPLSLGAPPLNNHPSSSRSSSSSSRCYQDSRILPRYPSLQPSRCNLPVALLLCIHRFFPLFSPCPPLLLPSSSFFQHCDITLSRSWILANVSGRNEAESRVQICGRFRARGVHRNTLPIPIGKERGHRLNSSFIIPEEDAKCRAHQGHEAVCLRSIGATPLPHLPFFYPAVVPPRCTRYTRCGSVGRTVRNTTGFPALGSSAVRRPGRSSEAAGPPVALPAPARGFRAGVLSLLYSGGDQSASSFLEAFCLFRRAPSVPALRLCALRSAPLRAAPRRAAVPNFSFPAFLVPFVRFSPDLSFSFFLPRILCGDKIPQLLLVPHTSADKFHASYTTSSSPVYLPRRRGLDGTRLRGLAFRLLPAVWRNFKHRVLFVTARVRSRAPERFPTRHDHRPLVNNR